MSAVSSVIPIISFILSLVFTFFVFKRYLKRRSVHLLIWSISLIFYGIGGMCEAFYGLFGWNPFIFRLWYLFGAVLVAAWLGQGTAYLLLDRRIAHILMAVLLLASIYSAFRIASAELDPGMMTSGVHTGSELSGHAIVSGGVRILTPFFNLYGTLLLVGGALWSSWVFYRKRILLHRSLGNILIAIGAIIPAFGGTFSRMGIPSALYIGELIGIILLFLGFLRATTPMKDKT